MRGVPVIPVGRPARRGYVQLLAPFTVPLIGLSAPPRGSYITGGRVPLLTSRPATETDTLLSHSERERVEPGRPLAPAAHTAALGAASDPPLPPPRARPSAGSVVKGFSSSPPLRGQVAPVRGPGNSITMGRVAGARACHRDIFHGVFAASPQ